jgi:threonine dehydrogenase-like Zn-dependent dehydrogenase
VPSAWHRALSLLGSGQVQVERLISGVYPLADWQEAFSVVEGRTALKTLLSPVV